MSNSLISVCVCLCLCAGSGLQPIALMAQAANPAPLAGNQQGTHSPPEKDEGIVLPAPLGGFSPRLTSSSEDTLEKKKQLVGRIVVDGLYTGNAFTVGSKPVDDYQYFILPSIGFQSFGARTQWILNYSGGLTVDQHIGENNQQQHDASADLLHKFTPRLASEFRQDYTITNNSLVRIGEGQSLPTVTGPGQLSPFAVPSPVTRIASISTANLTYRLDQHSGTGISGSFSSQHFRDVVTPLETGGSLIDTTTAAGRAFYLREISSHQTIGTEYQLQDLRFAGGLARTVDQTLFLFDSISIRNNMTLSLYAGPDRTHTHNVIVLDPSLAQGIAPVLADQWSASGGLMYTWQGKHTGFRLSGDRGVSDGGGLAGAVRLNTARLELEKSLGPRWSATLELIYSDGRSIGVPAHVSGSRVTTEQGLLGFLYRLTRNVSLNAQYGRIQQPNAGALSGSVQPDHNQVQAGVSYQLQKIFSQ